MTNKPANSKRIGSLTTNKLRINNYHYLLTESSETALLHDLLMYGDEPGYFLADIFKNEHIDWSGFEWEHYFPCFEICDHFIYRDMQLFKKTTPEELIQQQSRQKCLFSCYPKFTFAMIEDLLQKKKWCFQSAAISHQIQTKLEHFGYSITEISHYSEHSSILHDLHLYGSNAKKLLNSLLGGQDIDLTHFNFETYFPTDKQVDKKTNLMRYCYFWQNAAKRRKKLICYFDHTYPRLTFAMIETMLEQKKWLYP